MTWRVYFEQIVKSTYCWIFCVPRDVDHILSAQYLKKPMHIIVKWLCLKNGIVTQFPTHHMLMASQNKTPYVYIRDHFEYGPNRWETLHCSVVSHWLISSPEWSLHMLIFQSNHLPILFLKAKNQEQNENIPSIIIREIENFRSTYSQFLIKQLVLQLIKRYIEKHVMYTR